MMTIVGWVLAALFAGLAGLLWLRRPQEDTPDAVRPLLEELLGGRVHRGPRPGEPTEISELRRVLADEWVPRGSERRAAGDEALERIAWYLREAVARPLERAQAGEMDLGDGARLALDALADLEFFTRERAEEARPDNLTHAVQEVTREFAREYSVPVKLRGPERPVRAVFPPESFKDVLYLLLVNAARFGEDRAVEIVVDGGPAGAAVRVIDHGRGFSDEALAKATEPFYTTEKDSLGLGLTHARQVVESFGGHIRFGNRGEGGAEVELRLPPADASVQRRSPGGGPSA